MYCLLYVWKEEEMATHFSIPAWKIPGTKEPGGLQSMGSQRVEHDWSDLECLSVSFTYTSHLHPRQQPERLNIQKQ